MEVGGEFGGIEWYAVGVGEKPPDAALDALAACTSVGSPHKGVCSAGELDAAAIASLNNGTVSGTVQNADGCGRRCLATVRAVLKSSEQVSRTESHPEADQHEACEGTTKGMRCEGTTKGMR